MTVCNTTINDLPVIYDLFRDAIAYQERNGFELWPLFDRAMIEREIAEKRHWKIVDAHEVSCIFSVMYADPVIWGERSHEPAVYLHRITVNQNHKGKRHMTVIREWAMAHARQFNKKYVRMDTWGKNERLRNYYIQCGFPYIGQQQLIETEGLPGHYGGSDLSLFEIRVK